MQSMQYEITLPADYDMQVIRHRVETRGSATDGFPGLALKAYLIRERGLDGSPVNQYAPFYLWADPRGMSAFLYDGPFHAICADFGRPVVRQWDTVAFQEGACRHATPVLATRVTEEIRQDERLQDVTAALVDDVDREAARPGVVLTAAAVSPTTWQVVRFTLWSEPPDLDATADRYEVLHVSSPHRHEAVPGKQWTTR